MTGAVRIAVIGAAGWAGSRHVRAFHAVGGSVVALVDPCPQVHTLASSVGAEVLDSPDQPRVDDVDLVVVSLPSSVQPGVPADLVRRGFRVLVEKPIGSSGANAAVVAGIANIDDALMVGYTLHQHPIAQTLAAWIGSANVISISVRSAARNLSIGAWRAAPREGVRVWSDWSLPGWDRLGSESVQHFPEIDPFVEQAKKALRFAQGDRPTVGYRQALRATQLADDIVRVGQGRS